MKDIITQITLVLRYNVFDQNMAKNLIFNNVTFQISLYLHDLISKPPLNIKQRYRIKLYIKLNTVISCSKNADLRNVLVYCLTFSKIKLNIAATLRKHLFGTAKIVASHEVHIYYVVINI